MKYILLPVAVVLGICLIPVALVIALPDFIRSIKDGMNDK